MRHNNDINILKEEICVAVKALLYIGHYYFFAGGGVLILLIAATGSIDNLLTIGSLSTMKQFYSYVNTEYAAGLVSVSRGSFSEIKYCISLRVRAKGLSLK